MGVTDYISQQTLFSEIKEYVWYNPALDNLMTCIQIDRRKFRYIIDDSMTIYETMLSPDQWGWYPIDDL